MIGLVLVTHGALAAEFIAALEHVVGPQERITAICIGPDDDMEQRRQNILEAVEDVDDGKGVVVEAYSVLDGAEVADRCTVGPFARLRPASVLLEGSRVGNFVELKKTRLGAGAKASHLTYLGDATIGEEANIGAGVVTCNYDGAAKHPTEIGEEAFIGSDTMLVAPVTVGRRATTGAGSTITDDVPDEALGVGRSKQRNIPDWWRRRRKE